MSGAKEKTTGELLVEASVSQFKKSNTSWEKTGAFLLAHRSQILKGSLDGKTPEGMTDKEWKAQLTIAFGVVLQTEASHLLQPMMLGISGKMIEVKDKDGFIKWRSIACTESIIKNLSSIWNNMIIFGFDNLFQGKKLKGKTGLEQEYKAHQKASSESPEEDGETGDEIAEKKESIQDAIQRACKLLRDSFPNAKAEDLSFIDIEISKVYAEWDTARKSLVKAA